MSRHTPIFPPSKYPTARHSLNTISDSCPTTRRAAQVILRIASRIAGGESWKLVESGCVIWYLYGRPCTLLVGRYGLYCNLRLTKLRLKWADRVPVATSMLNVLWETNVSVNSLGLCTKSLRRPSSASCKVRKTSSAPPGCELIIPLECPCVIVMPRGSR